MQIGKRLKVIKLSSIGIITLLLAFVFVAVIGSLSSQEALKIGCPEQSINCNVYSSGSLYSIDYSANALVNQLFQIPLEDYEDEIKALVILFLVGFVGSVIFKKEKISSRAYQFWRFTRHFHIKFWDFLHQALAQGIIHSKTLDCA